MPARPLRERAMAGRRPVHVVNPEAWEKRRVAGRP
jgi:hypothetical protein